MVFPPSATVLEIGCAEADWITPMLAERPDLRITGIDWRRAERPCGVIKGDVLTYDLAPESFDVVVGISSIEHVGLGHYDGDPLDEFGDQHCMERVLRWLKSGGWVYFDVPYGDVYKVSGTAHREYDYLTLRERLLPRGLVSQHSWVIRPASPGGMAYIAVHATKES